MVNRTDMETLLRRSDPVPDNLHDEVSAALLASILERRDEMIRTDIPIPVQQPDRTPPTRRLAWVFAVAMATIVVAVGVVAALMAGPGEDSAGPEATPATEMATSGMWTRTLIEPGFHARSLRVTTFGLVAAALADGIWISEDGIRWQQVFTGPHEPYRGTTTTLTPPMTTPPPMPDEWSSVNAAVEFESTLYAFGDVVLDGNSANSTSQVVVWSSSDGTSWDTSVVTETSPAAGGFTPSAVLVTDDMIAAYEYVGSRIIYSEDGEGWKTLEPTETGFEGVDITDVTRVGERFVAVGVEYPFGDIDHNGIRSIYRSSDGLHFEKVPGSEFGENSYPYELASRDGVLFASGIEFVPELGDATAAVWRSRDGIEWQPVSLPPPPQPGWSAAGTPIAADNGLIIPVSHIFYDDTSELLMFVTEGGIDVEQIPAPAAMLDNVTEGVTGAFFNDELILLARGHCSFDCDPEPPLSQLTWTP